MQSGSPTSERALDEAALDRARGTIRDALGAIRNFEQLLKSIRVGPKALAQVIPDVHASCSSLRDHLRTLLSALAQNPVTARACEELARFVEPRVNELEVELGTASRSTMNAKNRLALELTVSRVGPELDAARSLVELLELAATGKARVDPVNVLRDGQSSASVETGNEALAASVESPEALEVVMNPRALRALIANLVKLCARSSGTSEAHIRIARSEGGVAVRISAGHGPGERLTLSSPPLVAPTPACLEAAARVAGARFERAPDGRSVNLEWPRPG